MLSPILDHSMKGALTASFSIAPCWLSILSAKGKEK